MDIRGEDAQHESALRPSTGFQACSSNLQAWSALRVHPVLDVFGQYSYVLAPTVWCETQSLEHCVYTRPETWYV